MTSRIFKPIYLILSVTTLLLMVANLWVHSQALIMSNEAMEYEKQITLLKQSNQRYEEALLTTSSVQDVSRKALASGYAAPKQVAEWIDAHVVAARP